MRYPTGIYQFDRELFGGLPAGITELSGPDSSGKTTVALSCVREASLRGLPCALIAMQGPPDTQWLRTAGFPHMAVSVPPHGEAALQAALACARRGFRVVVIDSIANVRPAAENELPLGEFDPLAPRILHHGLRELREAALDYDSAVILTNELRSDLGRRGRTHPAYDRVLRYVSDLRVRLARDEFRAEYGRMAWLRVSLLVTHSTTTPVGGRAYAHIFPELGIDRNRELLRALVESGTFEQVGAYWRGLGDQLGPGYARAAEQVGRRYQHYKEVLDDPG